MVNMMESKLSWREFIITRLIKASGYSAIVFVTLIFYFLLREGLPALVEVKLSNLFCSCAGTRLRTILASCRCSPVR